MIKTIISLCHFTKEYASSSMIFPNGFSFFLFAEEIHSSSYLLLVRVHVVGRNEDEGRGKRMFNAIENQGAYGNFNKLP